MWTLQKRLRQLIGPPPHRRPSIDRRRRLDARMPHLRLDDVKWHLACDRPCPEGVAQPVGRRARQLGTLVHRKFRGLHGFPNPSPHVLVQRLVADRRHGVGRARQQGRLGRRILEAAQVTVMQVDLQ